MTERSSRKRPGLSESHRAQTEALRQQGARVSGFLAAVRKAGLPEPERLVPDAFVIDHGARVVRLYEVMVCHLLSKTKLARLRAWRSALYIGGWSLVVFSVTGGKSAEVDLRTGGGTDADLRAAIALLGGS